MLIPSLFFPLFLSLCLSLDNAALEMWLRPIGTRTSDRATSVVSLFTHEWISLGVHSRLTGKRDRWKSVRYSGQLAPFFVPSSLCMRLRGICNRKVALQPHVVRLLEWKKDTLDSSGDSGEIGYTWSKWILLSRSEDLAKTESSCGVDCLDSSSGSLSIPVESESDWMGSLLSNSCRWTFAEAPTARTSAMTPLWR